MSHLISYILLALLCHINFMLLLLKGTQHVLYLGCESSFLTLKTVWQNILNSRSIHWRFPELLTASHSLLRCQLSKVEYSIEQTPSAEKDWHVLASYSKTLDSRLCKTLDSRLCVNFLSTCLHLLHIKTLPVIEDVESLKNPKRLL